MAFVGANPEAGEIIPETGGVRKIRWALQGTGKRGGASHLLLPQRAPARVPTIRIREEPKGEPQQRRAERHEALGPGTGGRVPEKGIGSPI